MTRWYALLPLAAIVGACIYDADEPEDVDPPDNEEEAIGVARQEIDWSGQTHTHTGAPHHRDISGAWVKWATTGNGVTHPGTVFLAYTHMDQGAPVAAWSWANSDWAFAPVWQERVSNASPNIWPSPVNLCQKYPSAQECGGAGSTWANRGGYDRPGAALWTGYWYGGAIVTTGGFGGDDQDVFVVTSQNGGLSFTSARAISLGTSGGSIEVGSLHASLAYYRERTNLDSGFVPLPIFAIWRNNVDARWYWTTVTISESGAILQNSNPAPIPPLDGLNAATRASIIGFRRDGVPKVAVFWGERTSASNNCATAGTTTATWKVIEYDPQSATWGCFKGSMGMNVGTCSNGKSTIMTDPTWSICVKPGSALTNAPTILNNLRPEVAMNAPADDDDYDVDDMFNAWWYVAFNKKVSGHQRVLMYRTGGALLLDPATEWELAANAPSSVTPFQPITDSYGQSIFIHQAVYDGNGVEPQVTMTWRAATAENNGQFQGATYFDHDDDVTELAISHFSLVPQVAGSVPWSTTGRDPGLYTATFGYQRCHNCGPFELFSNSAIPKGFAWSDGRDNDVGSFDAYARIRSTW